MGLTHFDDAPSVERTVGHLQGRWTMLGEAAGAQTVGVRRIEVAAGSWSTPVHDHGGSEELFYVLGGRGLSWHGGATAEIRAGDCIAYLAGAGGHTLYAQDDLDVLAFGPRHRDLSTRFPRLGLTMIGARFVESIAGDPGGPPLQFVREVEIGAPELPAPGPRPASIVNLADVHADRLERPRVARTRRNLGRAAGSAATGLQHVEVDPGFAATPAHCHSLEEEIFIVLDGDGAFELGDVETPVRAGHVIARPAATGVSHRFLAGANGLTFLAYGTREPNDICFYPHSGKVSLRGIGVIARVERLSYWDGED